MSEFPSFLFALTLMETAYIVIDSICFGDRMLGFTSVLPFNDLVTLSKLLGSQFFVCIMDILMVAAFTVC